MRALRVSWKVAASSAGIAAIAAGVVAGVALSGSAQPVTTGRQVDAGQSVQASPPASAPAVVASSAVAAVAAPSTSASTSAVAVQQRATTQQQGATVTDPTTPAATNAPQNDPAPSASAPADTNQTLGVGQTGDDGVRRAPAPPSTIKSKPSDPKQAKPSVEPIPSDSGSATTPGS